MKVLIVDDHAVFREGFAWILARLGPDTEIVEASNVPEALTSTAANRIDLVILDLYLPGYRGLDALRLFRNEFPGVRIVLLSGTDDSALIREGLAAGAQGFIHKSARGEAVLEAVSKVLAGGTCLVAATPLPKSDDQAGIAQLTQRQREILTLICDGMSYKEIARRIEISDATVRNHVMNIFERLAVHSRTEAALLAHRHGLITMGTQVAGKKSASQSRAKNPHKDRQQ